jgi:uncharacterized protein YggE
MNQRRVGLVTTMIIGLLLLFAVRVSNAQESMEVQRSITVSGTGTIEMKPDVATLNFSVVTRDMDAEQARALNATAAADAMETVRSLGVPEENIRLQHLDLQPHREYDRKENRYIEKGFQVSRSVTVEIDDLDLVPTVVTRVVQHGANRIGGVAYGLKDEKDAKIEALKLAILNARQKADAILGPLDEASLGPVISVQEQGIAVPRPVMAYAAESMRKADAAPEPAAYAPGELTIRANVTATFHIQ